MRRQYGVGGTISAGSGRGARPDPHSLPVQFDARDGRADGGIRHIEINRERIVVRRAVSGVRMALNVRLSDYLGIAKREADDTLVLVLVHRDPSLSVPLYAADETDDINEAWTVWSNALALPRIDSEQSSDGPFHAGAAPAQRRRRHNAIKNRRASILMRRKAQGSLALQPCHGGEREIIARD